MKLHFLHTSILLALFLSLTSCTFYKTEVATVDEDGQAVPEHFIVESPTKLHLHDGSVVLYDKGFEVKEGHIVGAGEHYDLTRTSQTAVNSLPTDDVAFLEYYDRKNRRVISALTTVAAVGGGTVGTIFLYKAIFGSCPTVYSQNPAQYSQDREEHRLEAELFSHSISSRYETDDLDRLEVPDESDGTLSIYFTNEALETHYINKLNILAVDHPKGYEALPTPDGDILVLGKNEELLEATSKSGDDVKDLIASRDQRFYRSGDAQLQALTEEVSADWIDLTVKVPEGIRTMYLSVKARNTLFATVFFYDIAIC